MRGMRGMSVRHANDLQPGSFYFFVLQDAHTRGLHRVQILVMVTELFVVSRHEIDSVRRRQLAKRLPCALRIDRRAVVQIARDKNCVWLLLAMPAACGWTTSRPGSSDCK